ncbi:transcription elongation factor, mitochondrial isoform X2 [Sorex araneus]|uniref:transcription elongation factor, mitochondrial isoform X2 n=1 Tax=Sorex araneus TaxID=42254 RepID=UPI002433625F|nr:transcription elongation factor, mitochondrial isoform X2 [Sorex araneus]
MSVTSLLLAGGRAPGLLVKWRCFPVPLESSLFQALPNSCCRRKSTSPEVTPNADACDEKTKASEKALDQLFSSEQQTSILHVLNTASNKELEAFRLLRGRKSTNIVAHREKFGPFQNLESIMNVPLFQYKTTVQVCNSILCPGTRGKKKQSQENRLLKKLIKPDIELERLKAINSIVSIVYGTRKIAWAHLDRKLSVLDWQQNECCRLVKGTYPTSNYFEKISSIITKMPRADFYILEKIGISIQNSTLFPILLHFHIIEAMLYALLNQTFAQDGQQQVLSMNRNAVGKHFELMVGDTRTSGKEVVKKFLSESVLSSEPRVHFPSDKIVRYRQLFASTEHNRVEELYDSLLQAVAFFELVVFDAEP